MKRKTTSLERRQKRLEQLDKALGASLAVCGNDEKALELAYEVRHTALVMLDMKIIKAGDSEKMKGVLALSALVERMQHIISSIQDRAVKIQIQNVEGIVKSDVREQLRRIADNPAFSNDIEKYQDALLNSFAESTPEKSKIRGDA